ncbi:DUF4240 domain-containing protein [Blastococcus sp. LR1]|uniref:DUF4240 domain-containing protein n=1 Tax=Blastococcus sp. LR1 TaxID=2877000 RepID=UPI001CCD7402|nr:DUF4240 domain-containing protein [Blastococcus sp. LR1]MCA0143712.1 DUF4240 domain-containing protein [Blastococcus sp. LR1]
MDTNAFWALVEDTRAEAREAAPDSVVEQHVETLTDALEELSDDDVRGFYRQLMAVRARANSWDLWAAAHLALGGASDDSFLDFRNWLISLGRETFERVLADPDAVADLEWDDDEEDFAAAEAWAYAPLEVLEERGFDDAEMDPEADEVDDQFGDPTGEPFPEDDDEWFARRFPRLWARYGSDQYGSD